MCLQVGQMSQEDRSDRFGLEGSKSHNSESGSIVCQYVSQQGRYRAARAAKKKSDTVQSW